MKTFIDTVSIEIVDDGMQKTIYDGDHEARCVVPSHWSETDILIMIDFANQAFHRGGVSDEAYSSSAEDVARWTTPSVAMMSAFAHGDGGRAVNLIRDRFNCTDEFACAIFKVYFGIERGAVKTCHSL